jgi:NitT/TauT family transport system permease protein
MKKASLVVMSLFVIFIVWLTGFLAINNPLLLPSPLNAVTAFFKLFTERASLLSIVMTIVRLLLAMVTAVVLGGVFGIAAGFKPAFATFVQPIVTILRTVPVISVIVIILILFGFRIAPYIITFLMIFPLVYQAFYEGIKNLDSELTDVYKLEDDRFFSGLWHCYLPLMRHQIETVLLQAAGLGIKVLVMAEYLSQTKDSIGNAIYYAKINLYYDQVFAWTLLLIVMAVGLEILISRFKKLKEKNIVPMSPRKSISD